MAPAYRTATQTRRGNRGAVEVHDDFEGLPVRQWRRTAVTISPPKVAPVTKQNDVWRYEQIHGMPKDWNQLPIHNQELLRAARAGYLNRKPNDDKETEKDKSTARLASLIFPSSKSVVVTGSTSLRRVADSNAYNASQDLSPGENADAPVLGENQETPNPRKRSSPPDDEEDIQATGPNKRQAIEKQPAHVKGDAKGKPKLAEPPMSDLDREIALIKARAEVNGEEVDIVVEYKFKVKDQAKARPIVRAVPKSGQTREEVVKTAQEKREQRKERLKNSKEGLEVEVWRAVPRSDEGPGLSYLAKRHKNTITLASKAAETQTTGRTVTRAIVRRIDAAGNPYEQTVTLEEGQTITDGQIISTTLIPAPNAPESGPAQPTPAKRRPPPPKRKGKGPGRGRKKGKLPIPASTRPVPDGAAPIEGSAGSATGAAAAGTAGTATTQNGEGPANQDTEMVDSPAVHSDDEEGDEGDDDEGDEGGEGDEAGDDEADDSEIAQDQDQEMKDTSLLEDPVRPISIDEPGEGSPASTSDEDPLMARSRANNPLALAPPPHLNSPRLEGSPLKHVVSITPTNQSPTLSPSLRASEFAADSAMDSAMDIDSVPDLATDLAPSQPAEDVEENPTPAASEAGMSAAPSGDDIATEPPLDAGAAPALETAVEGLEDVPASELAAAISTPAIVEEDVTPPPTRTETEPPKLEDDPAPIPEEQKQEPEPEPEPEQEPEQEPEPESEPMPAPSPPAESNVDTNQEATKTEPEPAEVPAQPAKEPSPESPAATAAVEPTLATPVAAPAPAVEEEDDGMPDLLGGLERELDRQAAVDESSSEVKPAEPKADEGKPETASEENTAEASKPEAPKAEEANAEETAPAEGEKMPEAP